MNMEHAFDVVNKASTLRCTMEEKSKQKNEEVLQLEWETCVFAEDDRIVQKFTQLRCAFAVNLMMTAYGLVASCSSFLIPQLEDPVNGFGITLDEGSWLASIMVVGSLSGSLCGGIQCGRFGRKKSLLFDSTSFMIGSLLMSLSPNFYLLLVGRFIHGHSCASAMVAVPIYTSEISQPEVRKITGAFTLVCYTTGFALALVLGAVLPWRWAVGSNIVVPVVCFILLLFCPETPVWYLMKNRQKDAKMSLEKLRGKENVDIIDAEMNRILLSLKLEEKKAEVTSEDHQSQWIKMQKVFALFVDPSFLRPFGYLLVVFCFGLEWTGFPAIGFYMVSLLSDSQVPIDPFWAAAMLASFRSLVCIVGSPIVKKCKRRPLYLCSGAVQFSGLISLSAYCYFNQGDSLTTNFPFTRWIPIFSIMLMYSAFSFGIGNIPYMLQGELLPSHARSFGSGLLGFIDNLSLFISCKLVPTLNEYLGIHGTFLMYAGVCCLVALISFFCMPETSGLSLEQIEDMYRPKKDKKERKDKMCISKN